MPGVILLLAEDGGDLGPGPGERSQPWATFSPDPEEMGSTRSAHGGSAGPLRGGSRLSPAPSRQWAGRGSVVGGAELSTAAGGSNQ